MKLLFIALLMLTVILPGCGQYEPDAESGTVTALAKVCYWTNAPDDAYPTELRVNVDGGHATLIVRSNRDDRAISSIGIFEAPVEGRPMKKLVEAVQSRKIAELEDSAAEPGDIVRRIEWTDMESVFHKRTASDSSSDAFVYAERLATKIIDDLRKHGHQSVTLRETVVPLRVATEDTWEIAVTLANAGAAKVRLPNPSEWEGNNGAIEVNAVRNDVQPDDLRPHHQAFGSITGSGIEEVVGGTNENGLLLLEAGEEATIRGHMNIYLEPGVYDIEAAVIVQLHNEDKSVLLRGEIVSPGQQTEVVSPPGGDSK